MFLSKPSHLNPSTIACLKTFEISITITLALLAMKMIFDIDDFIILIYIFYFFMSCIHGFMLLGNIINALIHRLPFKEIGLIVYLLVFPFVIFHLLFI